MRYLLPEGVEISPDGCDLLQRMLLPDPAQRIQLEQIMVHPWFTTNLPPEVRVASQYMPLQLHCYVVAKPRCPFSECDLCSTCALTHHRVSC